MATAEGFGTIGEDILEAINLVKRQSWYDCQNIGDISFNDPEDSQGFQLQSDRPVGEYLLAKLVEHNVDHIFTASTERKSALLVLADATEFVKPVETAIAISAGYAADAYARLRGLGVLHLQLPNAFVQDFVSSIAHSYACNVPVVIISEAEETKAEDGFLAQLQPVVCEYAVIDDSALAAENIESLIASCRRHSKPVYLELRGNICSEPAFAPRDTYFSEDETTVTSRRSSFPRSDVDSMDFSDPFDVVSSNGSDVSGSSPVVTTAVVEMLERLRQEKGPLIVLGELLQRHMVVDDVLLFCEEHRIPFAVCPEAKGAVDETHPLFYGLHSCSTSRRYLSDFIRTRTFILSLGVTSPPASLPPSSSPLYCHLASSSPRHVSLPTSDVTLSDLAEGLRSVRHIEPPGPRFACTTTTNARPQRSSPQFPGRPNGPLSVRHVCGRLDRHAKKVVLMPDPSKSLRFAFDIAVTTLGFMPAPYFAPIGYLIPAAVAFGLAQQQRRVLCLLTMPSFQNPGAMELVTLSRLALDPVFILFNSHHQQTERPSVANSRFRDLQRWGHHLHLPDLPGPAKGITVHTEAGLDQALSIAFRRRGEMVFIEALVDKSELHQEHSDHQGIPMSYV